MKHFFFSLFLVLAASVLQAQQLPTSDRTRQNQVLADRATQSHFFMAIPAGPTPYFPAYVADSLKCKALFLRTGTTAPGLYRYDCTASAWVIVGDALTFNSGLTRTANNVQLNGPLANDVNIDLTGHAINLGIANNSIYLNDADGSAGVVVTDGVTTNSGLLMDLTHIQIGRQNSSSHSQNIILDDAGMSVFDYVNHRGLEGNIDFSAHLNPFSYPQKIYVDNRIDSVGGNFIRNSYLHNDSQQINIGDSVNNKAILNIDPTDNTWNIYEVEDDASLSSVSGASGNVNITATGSNGTAQADFQQNSGVNLTWTNGISGLAQGLAIGVGGAGSETMVLTDQINHRGIDGAEDFSPHLGPLSYPQKTYVDSHIPSTPSGGFAGKTAIDSAYSKAKRRLGPIYNINPTVGSSSLYTVTASSATWAFTPTGITVSGGDGSTSNRLDYTPYWTCATLNENGGSFISTTAGAGAGFDIYSPSAFAVLTAHVNTSTGALTLEVYRTGTTTVKATSASNLTITNGDTIDVKWVRSLANYFVTAKNRNTGSIVFINYTDPYTAVTVQTSWSAGHPGMVSYGGAQTFINNFYTVNNTVGSIVWYGNSIGAGLSSGNALYGAGVILGANMNDPVNIIAGGSNKTIDFLHLQKEIGLLKPTAIIYGDGINDIIGGVSQDTTNAHLAAANKWAHDNGIMMFFNDILPVGPTYGGASNATYQAAIITTNAVTSAFPDAIKVPTYAALLNATTSALDPKFDSGDQLHPNQYGQENIATTDLNTIRNFFNVSGGSHYSTLGWKYSGSFGGTCCGFVVQNTAQSATSLSGIRILDNSNALMTNIAIGSAASTTAPTDVQGPGNFQISTTTQRAFFGSQHGSGIVAIQAGGVTGASTRLKVTTTAIYHTLKTRFGDTTTAPTAWVHIKAGSTTVAPQQYDSGALLTTPVAGSEEFLTDRRYFTQTTGTTRQTYAWLSDLADVVNTSTDANYTITSAAQLVKLPVITAARTVTLPAASSYTGRLIRIWNQNTSGTFLWTFASTVKNNDSTTVTAIANQTWVVLESDGTNWNWIH